LSGGEGVHVAAFLGLSDFKDTFLQAVAYHSSYVCTVLCVELFSRTPEPRSEGWGKKGTKRTATLAGSIGLTQGYFCQSNPPCSEV
jgi:hypothetical protein